MLTLCSITSAQGHIGWQAAGTGVYSNTAIAAVKTQTQQISSADDKCMQHQVKRLKTMFTLRLGLVLVMLAMFEDSLTRIFTETTV